MFSVGRDAICYFLSALAMIAVAGALTTEISLGASKQTVRDHYVEMNKPVKMDIEPEIKSRSVVCNAVHKAVPNRPLKLVANKLPKIRLFRRKRGG
jgi:hypothetical protein